MEQRTKKNKWLALKLSMLEALFLKKQKISSVMTADFGRNFLKLAEAYDEPLDVGNLRFKNVIEFWYLESYVTSHSDTNFDVEEW